MAYEALLLNPRSAVITSNLGTMAMDAEEWESALVFLKKHWRLNRISQKPTATWVCHTPGLGRLGKEAESSYKQAITLQPNDAKPTVTWVSISIVMEISMLRLSALKKQEISFQN